MEGGAVGHNYERDPPKDHSCQLWCNLVQQFQRKRFKCDLFIKICLICIIGINWLKEKFQKNSEYMLNYPFPCSCSINLSSFRFIIKQQWTIEEISIFSNSSHLEWRIGLSDTILKGTHPRTIPARFGLIWFRGFRGEDVTSLCLNSVMFLVTQPPWLGANVVRHNSERGPHKDHSTKVWSRLAKQFQRRRIFYF